MMTGTTMMVLGGAGVVILCAAAGVTKMLSSESASVRHLVWTVALGLLVAVPVIHVADLRVEVPVPATWLGVGGAEQSAGPTTGPVVPTADPRPTARVERRHVAAATSLVNGPRARDSRPPRVPLVEVLLAEVPRVEVSGVEVSGVDGRRVNADAGAIFGGLLQNARVWQGVSFVWLAGAIALLVLTFFSHLSARRLTTRNVYRASPTVNRRFVILADDLGIQPMPRLVVSSTLRVPATWGLRRATVVLPDVCEHWSDATMHRVLLHELAHVRRRDCVTYLLGEVARAVHWPNPLVWLALIRQRAESERACDDLVLNRGVAASDYADDLLRLVRTFRPGTSLPHAAMAMARPSSGLAQRVRAVLDPAQSRRDVDRRIAHGVTVGALGIAFAILCVTPVAATPEQRTSADAVEVPGAAEVPEPVAVREPVEVPEPVGVRGAVVVVEPVAVTEPVAVAESVEPVVFPVPADLPGQVLVPEPQEHCVFQGDLRRSTSHTSENGRVSIRWETDACRVDIDMRGEVRFASDDSGVVGMAPGSSFEIEERIGRVEHRARFESSGAGFERRFWVRGDEIPWGPEADAWIAGILPEIFRHTTINAEARVRRMLTEGGSARVFQAVERMHTDHVRATYLELLVQATELSEAEYVRVIDFAGSMESDHTSGELLLGVVEHAGLRPAFQDPLLRAAEGLESDHQKSRVLEVVLAADLTAAQVDAVVRSAATIESDHNLGMVLSSVARSGRLSELGRENFLDALATIESDHNHGLVVSAFLDAGPLTPVEVSRVLEMTRGLESDHERGTLLRRIGSEYSLTGEQATAYLVSAAAIGSDHELGMTAQALTERRALSESQLELAFEIARRIGSDHSKATTLQTILVQQELTDDGVRTLLGVARGIGSDHQLATTLEVVIEEARLRPALLVEVLETAGGIGGSHQLATVLMAIADRYSVDGEARVQYERLAEGLSRSDRERALAAVRR